MRIMGFLAVAMLIACRTSEPCGVPTTTRCSGNVAQICSGGQQWSDMMDCDEVAARSGHAPWTCCAVELETGAPLEHSCVPSKACVNGRAL